MDIFKRFSLQRLLLLFILSFFSACHVFAAYIDKTIPSGQVRIHYSTSTPSNCDAILLSVGTSMSISSYDKLSEQIIQHGYVTVIMDHAPGNMVKTDSTKYATLANEIKSNLSSWLGGSICSSVTHWIMGGHSAGGQAAQNAIANNLTHADAIFSIDPYNASNAGYINVPAMYWGFDVTTCFVDKNNAAKAGYLRSQNHRAFYRAEKKYSWGPCGYSPVYFHCSFCDEHCPGCTNCVTTPQHFFIDVAASVNQFINATFYGTWSKSALTINATTPLKLFVDNELP